MQTTPTCTALDVTALRKRTAHNTAHRASAPHTTPRTAHTNSTTPHYTHPGTRTGKARITTIRERKREGAQRQLYFSTISKHTFISTSNNNIIIIIFFSIICFVVLHNFIFP
jgi:hypothetical protein